MITSAYIHIPFCDNICSYCDFCKLFYNEELVNSYLNSLDNEIKSVYNNESLKTIYIGGGTPSSLSIEKLKKLFNILSQFKINKKYEYTFECNIENITEEKLKLLKENKVNRLSIGVQSFNQNNLDILERKYNKKDILNKLNLAKKYFNNINIDLIYAVPNQTLNDLEKDLEEFIKLDINHISTYSLIIENNTKMKINKTNYIDEDLDSDMYNLIKKTLKNNKYIHYEVSNFAKKGYESKHNLNYWNNNQYYGFGLGASGYINNIRYTNTRSINNYIKGKYILEQESIDKLTDIENELILGLRKIKGINKETFYKKYNSNIEEYYDIMQLVKDKKIIETKKYYKIPEKLIYISNMILVEFKR